ncbi:hypothetical protein MG296_01810 [Flavobacteriaceae bacterium TK19130]|nr:hypothetical protein [Thermobacterium salinum]
MKKQETIYEAKLPWVPSQHIYLDTKNLKKGSYTLHIKHGNKIIKQTHFQIKET